MAETETQCPPLNFTTHPSTSAFAVPCETYLSNNLKKPHYGHIATGALLFETSVPPRILLIQRASHDSMPNKWEIPGGGCDDEDRSILYGVGREVWEETGLIASRIGPRVGEDHIFSTRSGKIVCKFNFLVDVEKGEAGSLDVKLNPNEHQAFIWATEEELKVGEEGGLNLEFTTREQQNVVMEAFGVRREMNVSGKS
jgi:8-oxo-dGTP pyrophosphatase MutT (NUDIX family)